jgi:hypothetical protein
MHPDLALRADAGFLLALIAVERRSGVERRQNDDDPPRKRAERRAGMLGSVDVPLGLYTAPWLAPASRGTPST